MIRSLSWLFLSFVFLPLWLPAGENSRTPPEESNVPEAIPLTRAHAHNDYNHDRPLLDALDHGFCSVEADVFLVGGRLLVGHSRDELASDRTLESLYLDPLLQRVQENSGRVFSDGPEFTLLVDIKSDGSETYAALDRLLSRYDDMLTSVKNNTVKKKAVTVIISGERAWEMIAADTTRYAGVDGRTPDLSTDRSSHLMPLVSDHWGHIFDWSGRGRMPDSERAKLQRIVDSAHLKGWRVRFWGTPDSPSPERTAIWGELVSAGVDLIGTDDLAGLRTFLLSAEKP